MLTGTWFGGGRDEGEASSVETSAGHQVSNTVVDVISVSQDEGGVGTRIPGQCSSSGGQQVSFAVFL